MLATRSSAHAYSAGRAAMEAGDDAVAQAAFRWASRVDPGNPVYAHAAAMADRDPADPTSTEMAFRKTIALTRREFGRSHPLVAVAATALVDLYDREGRHTEACRLSRRAIEQMDYSVAAAASMRTLRRLEDLCCRVGHRQVAVDLYRLALAHRRAVYGGQHPKVAECLDQLFRLYRDPDLKTGNYAVLEGAVRSGSVASPTGVS